MAWNLESVDGSVIVETSAENLGAMSGTLTVDGIAFNVSGYWANGQGVPGRNASCFEISGQHGIGPNLPIYIGAAGNMVGTPNWPQSVEIAGAYCSVKDGVVHSFNTTLLPVMNTDPGAVAGAYGESGCFLVIDVSIEGQVPVCIFGSVSGSALGSTDLAKVCSGIDPVTINIPKAAPNLKPVCILFKAPQSHFVNPPLEEPHNQISKILFDTAGANPANAVGLVLEYSNGPDKRQTALINFNAAPHKLHERTHTSVMIKPS
jgi:hypothetical protein